MAQSLVLNLKSIRFLIRCAIAAVFLIAGSLKIVEPGLFLEDIQAYRMAPYSLAFAAAFFLPWLEVFAGLALIFKRAYAGALGCLAAAVIIFIIALSLAWVRGLDINCGCFGHNPDASTNYLWALTRNFMILFGLLVLFVEERLRQKKL